MQKQTILGIDISKETLDIFVRGEVQLAAVIPNEPSAIRKFLKAYTAETLLIGMENTGRYNWALYEVLAGLHHQVYVLSPLHLKKSMGLIRGKCDKIDALRIAGFIGKNHSELPLWKPAPLAIQKLKALLTERTACVQQKAALAQQRGDASLKAVGLSKTIAKLHAERQGLLKKQIAFLEHEIETLTKTDQELCKQAVLIRSVPGVGKVLSWVMIAKTEGFTILTDPRKMACYCGVVPFANQSGTSRRGRPAVSHHADKGLKKIMHLAAMSAIRLKGELRAYYLRKVAEGKNKMSALNAVRNKIIHRIYATLKQQKTYSPLLNLS